MSGEIDRYLAQLARRLSVPETARETILLEVRSHLEESVDAAVTNGRTHEEAERATVQNFGAVDKIARRLSAVHQVQWRPRRYLRAGALGAAALWGIWMFGSIPEYIFLFTVSSIFKFEQPSFALFASLALAGTPISDGGIVPYRELGWPWVALMLVVFGALPFVWALRAGRWWGPALAYGLGAWLSAPWFVPFAFGAGINIFSVGMENWIWQDEARVIALALPVALIAASLGALWGRRQRARAAAIGATRLA
ncbi:MAG TPA: permease prefix domain 1-containing protein [Ktedonobacterales bacterium]|nr:permease prefix domain 1-containing protein [Ktedonobacterales bacterium]